MPVWGSVLIHIRRGGLQTFGRLFCRIFCSHSLDYSCCLLRGSRVRTGCDSVLDETSGVIARAPGYHRLSSCFRIGGFKRRLSPWSVQEQATRTFRQVVAWRWRDMWAFHCVPNMRGTSVLKRNLWARIFCRFVTLWHATVLYSNNDSSVSGRDDVEREIASRFSTR
jgi:hypothetical protein